MISFASGGGRECVLEHRRQRRTRRGDRGEVPSAGTTASSVGGARRDRDRRGRGGFGAPVRRPLAWYDGHRTRARRSSRRSARRRRHDADLRLARGRCAGRVGTGRLPAPRRAERAAPRPWSASLGLRQGPLERPDRHRVGGARARLPSGGGVAGPGLERTGRRDWSGRRHGRWACSSRATGEPPAGSSIPAARRRAAADLRARVQGRQDRARRHGAKVARRGCTCPASGLHLPTLNGERAHRRGARPGQLELPALQRVPDLRRHRRTAQRRQHARRASWATAPRYVRRSVTNPAVGPDLAVLVVAEPAQGQRRAGRRCGRRRHRPSRLSSVANYHVGGTINVDTGDGGDSLESRDITAIGTAGADGTGITFTPGLSKPHAAGATVTGSGNNIAASDPSAGAAVTPRMIARLEITYSRRLGRRRSSPTAPGAPRSARWSPTPGTPAPTTTPAASSPAGTRPGADLSATAKRRDGTAMGWIDAGIAPPPNLATKLVARTAEPVEGRRDVHAGLGDQPGARHLGVRLRAEHRRLAAAAPARRRARPAPTIRMSPAESLAADGTVDQASLMGGGGRRGIDLFNTYTTAGLTGGRDLASRLQLLRHAVGPGHRPARGLRARRTDMITGLRLQAATPVAG